MRQKAGRRARKLKQQLMNVRAQMADEMNDAYKKGSMENCKAIKCEEDFIHYCQASFPTNPNKLMSCKTADDHCEFCCEHEFSSVYIIERKKCIQEVCEGKQPGSTHGRWIWETQINNGALTSVPNGQQPPQK